MTILPDFVASAIKFCALGGWHDIDNYLNCNILPTVHKYKKHEYMFLRLIKKRGKI